MYRLLIVEDEKWIRLGIRAMINQEENAITEIFEAEDGQAGLALWRRRRPEIVLSDVQMPLMDGCAMCEAIYEEAPDTAFIILSGYGEFSYARRALGFRAADYLLKPATKPALNAAIGSCVAAMAERRGDGKMVDGIRALRRDKSEGDIVRQAVQRIEASYDQKLSLPALAAQLFVSEAYLSVLFKKNMGLSPIQYITNLRINRAVELLRGTDLKINDIAAMTGYPDQTYFTKVFKRVTGKSPTDCRQNDGD